MSTSITAPEILRKAKEVLAEGWTKGVFARDEHGAAVWDASPEACSFCAMGAVYRARRQLGFDIDNEDHDQEDTKLWDALFTAVRDRSPEGQRDIVSFNDDVAKDVGDVLDVFDEAIAKLEAAQVAQ